MAFAYIVAERKKTKDKIIDKVVPLTPWCSSYEEAREQKKKLGGFIISQFHLGTLREFESMEYTRMTGDFVTMAGKRKREKYWQFGARAAA